MESGWYFATAFLTNLDEVAVHPRKRAKTEEPPPAVELLAWAPPTQGLPCTVHVPYWSRKAAPGVLVKTMVEQLLESQEVQKKALPALEDAPKVAADEAAGAGAASHHHPEQHQHHDQPKGRGKGGGGWMNKAIKLMALMWDGEHDEAANFSAECLITSPTAEKEVYKRLTSV